MSEMLVETPLDISIVEDYDFTFVSGLSMNVTINAKKGDLLEETDSQVKIFLSSKPSLNNPNKMLPAETTTLYKQHIISIQKREREVVGLTPEQQLEWQQFLKEEVGTVN